MENKRYLLVKTYGNFRTLLFYCPCNIGLKGIHHECEGLLEKSVPRVTDRHKEAGQAWQTLNAWDGFLYPILTGIMDSFSCLPLNISFYIAKKTWKRLPENPEFPEMRHGDVILTVQWRHGTTCGQRVVHFYLSHGLVRECEIKHLWVKTTETRIWSTRIVRYKNEGIGQHQFGGLVRNSMRLIEDWSPCFHA